MLYYLSLNIPKRVFTMFPRKAILVLGMWAQCSLYAADGLIVVLSDDMNSTTALLQRYEKIHRWEKVGESVPVVLGRSGLGWADERQPQKYEGDGRSPAGVFDIHATFGYSSDTNSTMPYYYADTTLICVDDAQDVRYNKMALLNPKNPPKSYEVMHRDDGLYRYGALIGYNDQGTIDRGSCIFFHLARSDKHPTSGCTAMEERPLVEILTWLKPQNHPRLLQIPKSECLKYQKEFEGIECQ
jgi:L,D-peptidoglycan transpeptidase YkuD (ErfK/YbiS/YcfS/YnhG family)